MRALPAMAPLPAARAAPERYHHCGVSPAGCVTGGTSTRTDAGAEVPLPVVEAQAATHSVVRAARVGRR